MQHRKRQRATRAVETDWKGQVCMDHLPPRMRIESEASLKVRVTAALAAAGALVFRNNVGAYKKGTRWIQYGLCKGSSDLVCVAPGGRALFVELKRVKYGLISEEQKSFIESVRRKGAVAGVVRSVEEALALLEEAKRSPVTP